MTIQYEFSTNKWNVLYDQCENKELRVNIIQKAIELIKDKTLSMVKGE